MSKPHRSPQTEQLAELIFEVFRLHGELIAMGERMVGPCGLTSARWQVVGSIDESGQPLTVPMIARNLGISRQAVQRVVNDLEHQGLVCLSENPHHKTARLVELTEDGQSAVAEANRVFTRWANATTADLDADRLAETWRLLAELRGHCRDYGMEEV
ncbi:MarR family winged helix-turn-helix transcriptional regulator [Rhodovibrio salinarum]|nr:MarR family winged helix-turn-helix transcriptional regulator [Rhodovibrio salinarum]